MGKNRSFQDEPVGEVHVFGCEFLFRWIKFPYFFFPRKTFSIDDYVNAGKGTAAPTIMKRLMLNLLF